MERVNQKFTKNLFYLVAFLYVYCVGVVVASRSEIGMHGDSAIYFVYMKDFFAKPFLFGSEVKHGATGPLWVILNAVPFHYLSLEEWIRFAAYLNIAFIACLPILIAKSAESNSGIVLLLVTTILACCRSLFNSGISLYETPLALFLMSASIFFISKNAFKTSAGLAGLSVLCRPELIIWAVTLSILMGLKNNGEKFKINLSFLFFSLLPAAVIYSYLSVETGTILPSSVAGRAITSMEAMSLSWLMKFRMAFISKSTDLVVFISWVSLVLVFVFYKAKKIKFSSGQSVTVQSGISIVALFVFSPPIPEYSNRYMLILLPIGLFALGIIAKNANKYIIIFISSLAILVSLNYAFRYPAHAYVASVEKIKRDMLLGSDFADAVMKVTNVDNKMLAYEIQTQFYTNANLVSADGIVGGEFINVLLKKKALSEFIRDNKIKYVVTMNSFKYRQIFRGTGLDLLYEHDLSNFIGDRFVYNNLVFRKDASNIYFETANLYKVNNEGLRVYAEGTPWAGANPFWNSIYSVELVDEHKNK